MRKIFTIIFVYSAIFSSCETKRPIHFDSNSSPNSLTKHDYSEVREKRILWNEIFSQKNDQYFVYFYSLTCAHCESIKDRMIEYSLYKDNIYFVQSSEQIILGFDENVSLGAVSSDELSLLGYPSLIEINQKVCVFICSGEDKIISKLSL